MDIDVRPLRPDEVAQVVTLDSRTFGINYGDGDVEYLRGLLELDRLLVAVDGPEVVGSTGAWTFDMTVPGGAPVPTAGVTWVSVAPTHRRRGILRTMMRRQLDDIAAGGEPLAALTASESVIYGRFGYGMATRRARLVIPSHRVRMRDGVGDDGLVRFVDLGTARKTFPEIYDRMRARQPGTVSRNEAWWDVVLGDHEWSRQGASALYCAAHPDGYVVYRRQRTINDGFENGDLLVIELVAASFDAYASLWRFLLGVDLIDTITFRRFAPDEALPWLVDDPRRASIAAVWDDVWLRVLDVEAALGARRYLTEDRLVLEVVDAFRPATGGRYVVEGSPDGATCGRTSSSPDLVLGVDALGSLYLGGVRAVTLAAARRLEECTPGAVRRADAFFASDVPPHNQTGF